MTPLCLILSCLRRMHVFLVSLPSVTAWIIIHGHRERVKVKGGVTVRSSPPTKPLSNLVLCGVIFLQRRLFCKTLFPLSDI